MAQKPTLIKNIILSEIEYERKRIKLLTTDDVERESLSDSMDRDHEIISKWCTDFSITREEIEAKRDKVLDEESLEAVRVRDEIITQSEQAIQEFINDPVTNRGKIEDAQNRIDEAKRHEKIIQEIIITIKPRPILWQL